MAHYRDWKRFEETSEHFSMEGFLVNEKVKRLWEILEKKGFEPYLVDNARFPNTVITKWEGTLYRYGDYRCYIYFDRHYIRNIEESFSGAETGVAGWGSLSFAGLFNTEEHLRVILETTGVSERITKFSKGSSNV